MRGTWRSLSRDAIDPRSSKKLELLIVCLESAMVVASALEDTSRGRRL